MIGVLICEDQEGCAWKRAGCDPRRPDPEIEVAGLAGRGPEDAGPDVEPQPNIALMESANARSSTASRAHAAAAGPASRVYVLILTTYAGRRLAL